MRRCGSCRTYAGNRSWQFVRAQSWQEVPSQARFQFPSKMHVWGAASGVGKSRLVVIEGNLDAARYQDILKEEIAGHEGERGDA